MAYENRITFITSVAMMAASSATAQSSSDQFYISGYAELGYFDNDIANDTFARANFDMGFLPNAGNSGFPIGFSLGIDGYSADLFLLSDQEIVLYPAVTFAFGNSLISAGVPRSVFDQGYIPHHNFGGTSRFDLDLHVSLIAGSLLASFYLLGTDTPYGIRYDGTFGNTKIGGSYHRTTEVAGSAQELDYYALAFQHQIDTISSFYNMLFFGGIEHNQIGASSETLTNYQLGVEGGTEKLHAGIILGRNEFIFSDTTATTTLYVDYKISDSFSIDATVSRLGAIGGTSIDFYGLGLEYSFLNGGYLRANITGSGFGSSSADRSHNEVVVGWRF